MTYKINGVALDDRAQGWTLVRGSIPVSALEYTSPALDVPGVDGTIFLPSTRRPAALNFIVKSTLSSRSKLLALMATPKLELTDTNRPGKTATLRLLASTVEAYHEAKGWAKDLFVLEMISGCWRGGSITSPPTPIVVGGTTHNVFTDLSAPVQDAVVKITGPITNPQVVDSGGSFIKLTGEIGSGLTLSIETSTGRAYVTGGTPNNVEVSGLIDFNGPRGGFEITPSMPAMTGKLTVTGTGMTSASTISVTGKPAYLY